MKPKHKPAQEQINLTVESLRRKGCEVIEPTFLPEIRFGHIDISKAYNLGNKSWGRVDMLTNYSMYVLSGVADYLAKQEKIYALI